MTIEPTFHETPLAVIERRRPDLLIVRYLEHIAFDSAGIAVVLAEMERIMLVPEFGVITVLPKSGDMSMEAMQQDHGSPEFNARVRAHGIVGPGTMFKRLAEIHYDYHPQQHQVRTFDTEEEALGWVEARLDDRSVA